MNMLLVKWGIQWLEMVAGLLLNPMLKDSKAIAVAKTSHKEFSLGYTANLVKARDGVDADFEMKDIRVNHLSLVGRARAGKEDAFNK